jgi:hypothetical protein
VSWRAAGLRAAVLASPDAGTLAVNRTFGIDGAGHETLFLHAHLDRALPAVRAPALGR